jgi:hypothetical protein
MWHVVPSMKSTLNEIPKRRISYALCAYVVCLFTAGWQAVS